MDKIIVNKQLLIQYWFGMANRCFKLLPVFEHLSLEKKVMDNPEQAYLNYKKYIHSLLIEVSGNSIFIVNNNTMRVISILNGLTEIKKDEHDKLRPLVFECINLCKKIVEELESDSDGL